MSTKTKTYEQCCDEVAKKLGYARVETLFPGFPEELMNVHKQIADLYREEGIREAVKLATTPKYYLADDLGSEQNRPIFYSEQEIIDKLKIK